MNTRYVMSDHIEMMEDEGVQIILNQSNGDILKVNNEVIELLQFLSTERNFDDLKTFFAKDASRSESELLDHVKSSLDLLLQYALVKPIEG